MGEAYARAAAAGAEEIVSVHLSAEVSATYESALLAARKSRVPVHTGRHPPDRGGDRLRGAGGGAGPPPRAPPAPSPPRRRGSARAACPSLFYVDTLEHLRRGGRMGAAAALLGSALAVKPILCVENGRISPKEKVRTAARALARLEDLAVGTGGTPTSRWR